MRFIWFFAATTVLLAFVVAVATTSSEASAACNPGRSNTIIHSFDSWYKQPGGAVYGVKADVEEYDPYVASSGGSSAWVMLQSNDPQFVEYGQIGWKDVPGLNRNLFIQFTYNQQTITLNYPPKSVGLLTNYRVEYNGANGFFSFYANGQYYGAIALGFVPTQASIAGETISRNSQMPGGFGNGQPQNASHLWIYNSYHRKANGQWSAFNGTKWHIPYPQDSGQQILNFWDIDIWDKACYN